MEGQIQTLKKSVIEKASTMDEVTDLRDKAESLRKHAKVAKHGLGQQNHWAELKIRAERRGGQILIQMAESGERAKRGGDRKSNFRDGSLKLSDLGVSVQDSHRWQILASVDEEQFEAVLAALKEALRELDEWKAELTSIAMVRECKRATGRTSLSEVDPPEGQYHVIVVDPPWPMEKIERDQVPTGVGFDYPTMTLDDLIAWEVPQSIAMPDAHLFLWTTQRFLPSAFGLLNAWGFRYVFAMVWHKGGGFQPYHLPQYTCEFILYGRCGSPEFLTTKGFKTDFEAPREGHSIKPAAFYELVERVTGDPRIDLFSRQQRPGFATWGNQAPNDELATAENLV